MAGTAVEDRTTDRWNGVEGRAWVAYQPHYDAMPRPVRRARARRRRALAGAARARRRLRVRRHDPRRGPARGGSPMAWSSGPTAPALLDAAAGAAQPTRDPRPAQCRVLLATDDPQVIASASRGPRRRGEPARLDALADPVAAFFAPGWPAGWRPGGRLSFVTWRDPGTNVWFTLPLAAAAEHVDLARCRSPRRPGTVRVRRSLTSSATCWNAGFTDVELTAGRDPRPGRRRRR